MPRPQLSYLPARDAIAKQTDCRAALAREQSFRPPACPLDL
ncbi:MAG: hypothetical protein OEN02_09925 [Gammaproteobacteria bacterium]|nr:hypothetical protein [Gammaproteobacteria bacterium]MDH3537673.1 hypothetical protein [Gammaproteobacteria bacterium]